VELEHLSPQPCFKQEKNEAVVMTTRCDNNNALFSVGTTKGVGDVIIERLRARYSAAVQNSVSWQNQSRILINTPQFFLTCVKPMDVLVVEANNEALATRLTLLARFTAFTEGFISTSLYLFD